MAHTGAMIALFPDKAYLGRMARAAQCMPHAQSIDDLHVTVCYLGTAADLDKAAVIAALQQFRSPVPMPLLLRIRGLDRFPTREDDGTNALYARIICPELHTLRDGLITALDAVGVKVRNDFGSYTPHMTLGYAPEYLPTPNVRIPLITIPVGAIQLNWADDEPMVFPMTEQKPNRYLTEDDIRRGFVPGSRLNVVSPNGDKEDFAEMMLRFANPHMMTGTIKEVSGPMVTPAHGPGGLFANPALGGASKRRSKSAQRRLVLKAANYGARAGETITGNLGRGAGGQFVSAGNNPKVFGRSDEEKQRAEADKKRKKRDQTADETARQLGISAGDLGALRDAAEGGAVDSAKLESLGLVSDGEMTPAGRRALSALERGDTRAYAAALQVAKRRLEKERARGDRARAADEKRREREARAEGQETGRAEDKPSKAEERRAATEARNQEREAQREARAEVARQLEIARAREGNVDREARQRLAKIDAENRTNTAQARRSEARQARALAKRDADRKKREAAEDQSVARQRADQGKRDAVAQRQAEQARQVQAAAQRVGLGSAGLSALRGAAEGDAIDPRYGAALERIGLAVRVGNSYEATNEGRRALGAIEKGNLRTWQAAVQSARNRLTREAARTKTLRLLTLELELLRLKHGKHNQATHGRKGRAGRAGSAAYQAARAGGAGHSEALQAQRVATATERQAERIEAQQRRTDRLNTQAQRARAAANGGQVTDAQRAALLQKADRLEARARGEKVGPMPRRQPVAPEPTGPKITGDVDAYARWRDDKLRARAELAALNKRKRELEKRKRELDKFTPEQEAQINKFADRIRSGTSQQAGAMRMQLENTVMSSRGELARTSDPTKRDEIEMRIRAAESVLARTSNAKQEIETQQAADRQRQVTSRASAADARRARASANAKSPDQIAAAGATIGPRRRKMPVTEQKEIFGHNVAGRGDVAYNPASGLYEISFTSGFGGDYESRSFSPAQMSRLAAAGITLTREGLASSATRQAAGDR